MISTSFNYLQSKNDLIIDMLYNISI